MNEYAAGLVRKYRQCGLVVDTNLLLLYFIGTYDRRRIARTNSLSNFTEEDYDTLVAFFQAFTTIVVTPNVLTEVSNLSMRDVERRWHHGYLQVFSQVIAPMTEEYAASQVVSQSPAFLQLALTDVGIEHIARDKYLVLSDDLRLVTHLQTVGVDALNYNHIRELRWQQQ